MLFVKDDNLNRNNFDGISLIPLLKLFPNMKRITLNELELSDMVAASNVYAIVAEECIKACISDDILERALEKISFKSLPQNIQYIKQHPILTSLVDRSDIFDKYKWDLEYEYLTECVHSLTFINKSNLQALCR